MSTAVATQEKEISTILSIHLHLIMELHSLSDYVCLHIAFVDQYYILENLCLAVKWCLNVFASYFKFGVDSIIKKYL
jgi:hypothetical protein